jgi:hypothetical protein
VECFIDYRQQRRYLWGFAIVVSVSIESIKNNAWRTLEQVSKLNGPPQIKFRGRIFKSIGDGKVGISRVRDALGSGLSSKGRVKSRFNKRDSGERSARMG